MPSYATPPPPLSSFSPAAHSTSPSSALFHLSGSKQRSFLRIVRLLSAFCRMSVPLVQVPRPVAGVLAPGVRLFLVIVVVRLLLVVWRFWL